MLRSTEDRDGFVVSSRLFGLVILGLILVFVGIAIIILVSVFAGSGSVGGVILIGPIPIVFGSGSEAGYLIVVAAVLTIISIITFLVMNRRVKRLE